MCAFKSSDLHDLDNFYFYFYVFVLVLFCIENQYICPAAKQQAYCQYTVFNIMLY